MEQTLPPEPPRSPPVATAGLGSAPACSGSSRRARLTAGPAMWQCMSTPPGITTIPVASMTLPGFAAASANSATTRPSSMKIVFTARRFPRRGRTRGRSGFGGGRSFQRPPQHRHYLRRRVHHAVVRTAQPQHDAVGPDDMHVEPRVEARGNETHVGGGVLDATNDNASLAAQRSAGGRRASGRRGRRRQSRRQGRRSTGDQPPKHRVDMPAPPAKPTGPGNPVCQVSTSLAARPLTEVGRTETPIRTRPCSLAAMSWISPMTTGLAAVAEWTKICADFAANSRVESSESAPSPRPRVSAEEPRLRPGSAAAR